MSPTAGDMYQTNKSYLFAGTTVVLLLHEGLMKLQDDEELFVGSVIHELAGPVWAGNRKALLVISSLPDAPR